MRSVVVDSSAATIAGLLDLLAVAAPTRFVDYGCGRGAVLLEVARRFPDLDCVGVDFDAAALGLARIALDQAGLRRVTLVAGDVLDHVGLATDIAYCYLGGALNQRLGHAVLEGGAFRHLIAARYPVIGAIPARQVSTGNDTLFVYDREGEADRVEWDAPATLLAVPPGAAYLLSRAIRVGRQSPLSLDCRFLRAGSARIANAEFGLVPARPGVPIICDMLIGCDNDTDRGETIIEVTISADGVPLAPSHLLVVSAAPSGAAPRERLIESAAQLAEVSGEFALEGR